MSVLINADTSDGLKFTSDTSGEIKLQSAGTDIATVSSSGIDVTGDFTIADKIIHSGDTNTAIRFPSADTVTVETAGTERMRIDSSGKVYIGCTSAPSASVHGIQFCPVLTSDFSKSSAGSTGGIRHIGFYNPNGLVGGIETSGSATIFAISSDYRLKENVAPMSGSIDRLKQLKPSTWSWTQDGSHGEGFLAHEAQAVVPEAVTGIKDAMRTEEYEVTPAVLDDDGNVVTEAVMGTREVPDYQGIDQSKLVPLLTAALQEAITKIEDLETRIQALENA